MVWNSSKSHKKSNNWKTSGQNPYTQSFGNPWKFSITSKKIVEQHFIFKVKEKEKSFALVQWKNMTFDYTRTKKEVVLRWKKSCACFLSGVFLIRTRFQIISGELTNYRSSHRRCFWKKVVLKNFAKFTGKTPVAVSFVMKLQALGDCFSGWLLLTLVEEALS